MGSQGALGQRIKTRGTLRLHKIIPRSGEANVVLDALQQYLLEMSRDETLQQIKSFIDAQTTLRASPVLAFTVCRIIGF